MAKNTVTSEIQNYVFPVRNALEKTKIILLDTHLQNAKSIFLNRYIPMRYFNSDKMVFSEEKVFPSPRITRAHNVHFASFISVK